MLKPLIVIFLVGYGGLVALLYFNQRKLLYLPTRQIGHPAHYGLADFSEETTETDDGVPLQLWHRPAEKGFPTIVYFHGNAGNIGDRAGIYAALAGHGFGVLGVSYRGYGRSGGAPSEQGLYADARAAIAFMGGKHGVFSQRLIFYGESLGTGVAIHMAAEHAAGAVVLQAPYTSISRRAAEIYWYMPVRLLMKDHFRSIDKIAAVKSPLILFHGELDATIPVKHGKELFEAANHPKKAFILARTGHNDFDSAFISAHVLAFAQEHGLITR